MLDKAIIEREMRCAQSLVEFRKTYLAGEHDVESPRFHHEWSEILLHGHSNYAIEGFRESGKDQIVFQANIMHALTYPVDYRSYILMVGANKTDMASKMKDITRQWQSPQHDDLRVNVQKIVEDSGDAFEVLYQNGQRVRIETFGKGGAIRGRVWGLKRPDIIILNDIQDPEDMNSDTIPETDWDWFISNIMFMGKSCRIFMIGNNVGARCVIERTIAHAAALNFKTMRVGIAEYLKDDGLNIDVGEPTWPQRWTKDEIRTEYLSLKSVGKADHYMREKMCMNMSPLSHPLHNDRLCEFDWHDEDTIKEINNGVITTVIDPAISKKKTADPSVIMTVADTKSGKRYILDVDFRRRDPNELVADIFKMVGKWHPVSVGVETVAYQQALVTMLENERKLREIPPDSFRVVEIKTRQNKNLKISGRLQPLIEAGLIYVPRNASWLPALKDQMAQWPDGEHDDILDTLSMVDDAKIERLVPTFLVQNCVIDPIKVPSNWPRWSALAADPNGDVIILILVCSPEGRLFVTNEIKATGTPPELYAKYMAVLSGRHCSMMFAPKEMFDPDPLTGNVWAGSYLGAGFPLCPGGDSWKVLLPEMIEQFDKPSTGAAPRLQIFRNCQELIWELSSAAKGDEGRKTIIALRALMMILGHRPTWRDATNEDSYGDTLRYPDADVP